MNACYCITMAEYNSWMTEKMYRLCETARRSGRGAEQGSACVLSLDPRNIGSTDLPMSVPPSNASA